MGSQDSFYAPAPSATENIYSLAHLFIQQTFIKCKLYAVSLEGWRAWERIRCSPLCDIVIFI